MTFTAKIPTTIVTGFLGAGKTSLIRHVMEQVQGKRIALLINEFGDVGVDGDILKSCASEGCPESAIIELPNGCICCTVADDFLPAIEQLLAMPGRFDHIVIETSGLALPKPLLKAFDWPAIRSRLTVDGVIAVVDGPAVASGQFADDVQAIERQKEEIGSIDHDNPLAEVYEDQLLCADLIILNKTDRMSAEEIATVRASIAAEVARNVQVVEASHGKVAPTLLLGLGAAAESDLTNRPSHHDTEESHDHQDFDSFVIDTPEFASAEALHAQIAQIAAEHGVLRVKGYARIRGKQLRYLVQAVGTRINGYFDGAVDGRTGALVIIGQTGIDQPAIRAEFAGARLASVG